MNVGEELLVISEADMKSVMTMKDAVKLAEVGITADSKGDVLGDKFYMDMEKGFVKPFSGYIKGHDFFFVKEFTFFPNNHRLHNLHSTLGMVIIHDSNTGAPVAVMEQTWPTALRTGASTAITAKYLARPDSNVLTIYGAGALGRTNLEGLHEVFDLEEVRIVDLIPEARTQFIDDMSQTTGLNIIPVDSAREAMKDADMVITVTTANEPIIKKDWLEPGMFLAKLGSYQEIDTQVVLAADKVVVDKWEYTGKRAPEFIELSKTGLFHEADLHAEYVDIVAGSKPGRESPDETILYLALGLWGEYAAILPEIYRRVEKRGLGVKVRFKG